MNSVAFSQSLYLSIFLSLLSSILYRPFGLFCALHFNTTIYTIHLWLFDSVEYDDNNQIKTKTKEYQLAFKAQIFNGQNEHLNFIDKCENLL